MRCPKFVAAPIAGVLAASISLTAAANARSGPPQAKQLRLSSPPVLAVVSLRQQRITVYDEDGQSVQAPVSTGQAGYETPAGVFSVLQKNRRHYSNIYDGASMPFMQRLTWSGIALHAGPLPGRPASHGCIRMPYRFAEELFDLTRSGMRVVIVPSDVVPVEVTHAALFRPGPVVSQVEVANVNGRAEGRSMHLGVPLSDVTSVRARTWRFIAAAKAAEARSAAEAAEDARRVARKAVSAAVRPARELRQAEATVKQAALQLKVAERALQKANSPRSVQTAERAKAKAHERLNGAEARRDAVKAGAQPKIDAAAAARSASAAADAASAAALDAAKLAEVRMAPVSVLISRKTQRIYVRQGFRPVFDAPVAIRDPDLPIGTTVFSALKYADGEADLRWSALTMSAGSRTGPTNARPAEIAARATDASAVANIIERISIPQDARDRVNEVVSPGSSLIITDEEISKRETRKGTDFIVVMSGEPQGGLRIRKRPSSRYRGEYPYGRSPFWWW